jgi:hypothetical protein
MRFFFSFTFLSLFNVLSAQEIQFLNQYNSNEIGSYATEVLELNEQLLGMLSHDVEMYRISYEMPFIGEQIWVSGAAFLPSVFNTAEAYPMLVFNHGTTFVRTNIRLYCSYARLCGSWRKPNHASILPR